MMQLQQVDHIALICSDYERSKAFYTGVLGCTVVQEQYRAERDSWKCDLALNGRYLLELFSFPQPPPRPSGPEACGLRHLAFQVADLDAAISDLMASGIAVEPVRRDETRNGARFTFFKDPDGLPLELCEAAVDYTAAHTERLQGDRA